MWMIAGKLLTPYDYGIATTSMQISTILGTMAILGVSKLAPKMISELLAKNKTKEVYKFTSSLLKIVAVTSTIIVILMLIFSVKLSIIFKTTQMVIFATALAVFPQAFSNLLVNFSYGFQDMRRIFIGSTLGHFIKFVSSSLLLLFGFKFFGPIVGSLLGFTIISLMLLQKKFLSSPHSKEKLVTIELISPLIIAGLSLILLLNTQYIILTIMKAPDVTGVFSLAMMLASPITIIPTVFSVTVLPMISSMGVKKNAKLNQRYLIKLVSRYVLFLSIPLIIFLSLFSRQVILFFAKLDFLPATVLLPILAVSTFLFSFGFIFLHAILGTGKIKAYSAILTFTFLLYFVSALILVNLFSATGLAVSYFLSCVIFFILSFTHLKKHLKFKLPFNDILRILFSASVSAAIVFFIAPMIHDMLTATLFMIVITIIYLLILLKLNFFIKEDLEMLEMSRNALPQFISNIIKTIAKFASKFINRSYADQ